MDRLFDFLISAWVILFIAFTIGYASSGRRCDVEMKKWELVFPARVIGCFLHEPVEDGK